MNNTWTAIVVALLSGLVVAVWTQWRQDARHQDLREDKQEEQKEQAREASLRVQRDAVAAFVTRVRDLENERLDSWRESATNSGSSSFAASINNGVRDIKLMKDIEKEIDLLDLHLLESVTREHIKPLREAAQKNLLKLAKLHANGDADNAESPPPGDLGKDFFRAYQALIDSARRELNPREVEFKPLFT